MGSQKDALDGMVKFSGNDNAIVWPLWKDDLMNRMKFVLEQVATGIVQGKMKQDQVTRGDKYKNVQPLINMTMAKSRSCVTFRTKWVQKERKKSDGDQGYLITMVGKHCLKATIAKTNMS